MKNFFLGICLIVLSGISFNACFGEDVNFNAPHTVINMQSQNAPRQVTNGATAPVQVSQTVMDGPPLTKSEQYMDYGEKLFSSGNYVSAVKYFYAVTRLEPKNIKAWKKTAFCYYKLNKHNYAYGAFQMVLKYDSTDKDALEFMDFYKTIMDKRKVKEKREPIDSIWRAAVFPGFGQIYNGQIAKGIIVGSAFIVSTGLTLYYVDDEKTKYIKYKKVNENQDIAFNQAQEAWTAALIWGIITGGVYAAGIIDAGISYNCDEARSAGLMLKDNAVYLAAGYRW